VTGQADAEPSGPLVGLLVLDLATMIAAPFGAALLADLGAEVVKVELPGRGDTLRDVNPFWEGRSLYWAVLARNKKSITLDIRTPRGRDLLLGLVKRSDVILENFRPGTLERWGLGYDVLKAANPNVVLVRISGYGQTGPYRDKAGFGTPATAISGLSYITGEPDRPPIVFPIALADYLAGLFGALAALAALRDRDARRQGGQWVDVSLYESVFRLLETIVPEYGKLGTVRERLGHRTGITAPVGTFQAGDGTYMVLSVSNERIWQRFCEAIERADLLSDPRFQSNAERVTHIDALEVEVGRWFGAHDAATIQRILDDAGVPICPIYSMADIFDDPHYAEREDVAWIEDAAAGPVPMPNVVPRFSETPGAIRHTGPALGEHNAEVYGGLLGLDDAALEQLRSDGII
jgi:crotonobetainyl-CoA:carnitine CoA-transferase CaiB-like acyl-CoA transferase